MIAAIGSHRRGPINLFLSYWDRAHATTSSRCEAREWMRDCHHAITHVAFAWPKARESLIVSEPRLIKCTASLNQFVG
jgi:hypothetical protein